MHRLLLLFLGFVCLVTALPVRAALPATGLFSRTNLVAWCIVPFDSRKRGPEERAAMLERLGIRRLAYDWRSEHIPTFDAEVAALQKRHIDLMAWWFPAGLNDEAKAILACIERHKLHPQLWITLGTEPESDPVRLRTKIQDAAKTLGPVCTAAARLGCTVGLYNHLGWFGEPTNQVAVLQALRAAGHTNVGSVYNFHHGHGHIDTFASELQTLKPHLLAVNLNGMTWEGDQAGKKIIPLGEGEEELRMMQILQASGWRGPVGILGHTDEDAEVKLRKELAGLERLASRLHETPAAPPKRSPRKQPTTTQKPSHLPKPDAAVVDVDGGPALDTRVLGVRVDGDPAFRRPGVLATVRARLDRPTTWNILLASEAKSSPTHWELYTYAGTGDLSFYAPGLTPDTLRSGVNLCDGQWHVAQVDIQKDHVRLLVDGREVLRQGVERRVVADGQAAQLGIGRLVEGDLGCDGQIQRVGLQSSGPGAAWARTLNPWATLPTDQRREALVLTAAPRNPANGGTQASVPTGRSTGEPTASGREPASQVEKDWADNRWQETDIGPFLASNLGLSDGSTLAKGLTVKVGSDGEGAVAYDTATGALRAAWTGGFLKFDPMRFGLIGTIRPAQPERFTAIGPGPQSQGSYRFHRIHRGEAGTVLDYEVDGVRILEHPELRNTPAGPVFVRTLRVAPHDRSLSFLASGHLKGTNVSSQTFSDLREQVGTNPSRVDRLLAQVDEGSTASAVGVVGAMKIHGNTTDHVSNGVRLEVTLAPETRPVVLSILLWRGSNDQTNAFREFASQAKPGTDPETVAKTGPSRWPVLTTRGQRGADTDILAVDTLTLPYDNPDKALLFGSGIDFTPDGAGYLCTIHGDIWRVTGIDDSLQNLKWTRYATGLFQPLGLKVRDGKVFVLGRDRITRLHDLNQDGEADLYENFHDGIQTSTGGHDYVTCLEKDETGRFYYVDPIGVHRVSADGRSSETLATGFRNPNGMGVSPNGSVVTAAPQQGTWTPTSFIAEIRPGGYYGYGGPKITPERPLGYDAPLCWIPHPVDNSSGSQVWVPKGQWGPLGGQMLHLLWGRCGMMLVMRDAEPGQPARQGAVVPLPAKFLSGPNRGTFHPDGSLYVAGSTGWQTSAVKDGALQRVRFTGKRTGLPIGFRVVPNGVAVTFSLPLDRRTAEDPGSYGLKQWNYRYAEAYGSKDWSVKDPNREGRDDVEVKSARLEPDGRTVVLEIPGLASVMQMELKYNVDTTDGGKPLRGQFWFTVNGR